MKKWLAVLMAVMMVTALAGCGKKDKQESTDAPETTTEAPTDAQTEAPTDGENGAPSDEETGEESTMEAAFAELADVIDKIYEKTELVDATAMWDTTPVDLSSDETAKYFIGIGTDGVEAAVYSEPMMNVTPYSLCLIRAAEGADIDQMKQGILEGVDPIKWICVNADKVVVVNSGNLIMMVMADEETTEDVYQAFSAVTEGNLGEKLERSGVE